MPFKKNNLGGMTHTTGGNTWNRTTVRNSSGHLVSKTERHGSYTYTTTYTSSGPKTTYKKTK